MLYLQPLYCSSGPFVGGRCSPSRLRIHRDADSAGCPFRDAQGGRTFTESATSCKKILRGSVDSTSFQLAAPKTQNTEKPKTKNVPSNMINERGGDDFHSGTLAGSNTFTLGVSLASSTLASSYCWVSSS